MPCPHTIGASRDAFDQGRGWHEQFIELREGLVRAEAAAGAKRHIPTFTSDVIEGGQEARRISIPIAGAREVYLYVTGAPDVIYGAGTWADACLVDAEGKATPICHLKGLEITDGRHEIDRNLKSGVSGRLRIAGRQFEHGLHVYAPSKVRVPLQADAVSLEAWIGIDDWVGRHGAVRFHVTDAAGAARLDLWQRMALEFPEEEPRRQMKWERQDRILDEDWAPGDYRELARRYAEACRVAPLAQVARQKALSADRAESFEQVRECYLRSCAIETALAKARRLNFDGLRSAIEDLIATSGDKYPAGERFLQQLTELQHALEQGLSAAPQNRLADLESVAALVDQYAALEREALLANPTLDFDRLLLIRRRPDGDPRRSYDRGYGVGEYIGLPRQSSKCNPGIEQPLNWENDIAVLSPVRPEGEITTLYKPEGRRLITDIDLDWDAGKLLFSMPGSHDNWHVFEIRRDGSGLRQLTPDQPDVHFYDSCYLPSGEIAMVSTAPLQGVPCNAGVIVGMMYMMDADGGSIRQVCFEQDHTYCPTVLNDGRILYLRWDYTDTPHVWNRVLFSMNPDGTGQAEHYGSNSYWPNAVFYSRPIPNHPTKFVGIVTGHHVGRVGELIVFDPALGRHEVEGVVQRIPGRGQPVAPLIEDKLTEHSWPKFLHPYPLSDKHFLVSCKPTPDSLWGIYLVDVFDNMVLIKEQERQALLEPIPLRRNRRPPVIPSRVAPDRNDALVYMADVYSGQGLKGVPRGTVKKLRLFTYHFGYQNLAGIDHRVGADGPWEVKRVLGTVPVEPDGSAMFRVPAKTPISLQPLDEDGRAIQLMRSWMTAMPGETLSCVGCHEARNSSPPSMDTIAARRSPSPIEPWYGPVRGFSFRREVQPVLDKYCAGCHDGSPREGGPTVPDLRGDQNLVYAYRAGDPELVAFRDTPVGDLMGKYRGIFEPSYILLRSLVRVGGLESDLHVLPPKEFHAGTSELIQMLDKGHYNVKLDAEAWDRLVTWIDLNAPCHGTWSEFTPIGGNQRQRRCELRKLYGGIVEDGEDVVQGRPVSPEPVMPEAVVKPEVRLVRCKNWPLAAEEARRIQVAEGPATRTLQIGDGVALELVRIPAGSFVMGDANGASDEQPLAAVAIEEPFWMGRFEVTNRQFAQFDPSHDSRFEDRTSWIFSEEYLGWPLNGPNQPVVRVSWERAMAFCRWLSQRAGLDVSLPTEAQWEYACRAGSDRPMSFGGLDADFAPYANMADYTMRNLAYEGWRPLSPDIVARENRFNDGQLVTAEVGRYQPNAWGLHDMHGNAWEWTRSAYRGYPYQDGDGRNDTAAGGERVVRGGSWYDRPNRCRASFRLAYPAWQRVFNVGFRVVCSDAGARRVAAAPPADGPNVHR